MQNNIYGKDIPMGFGMALIQNKKAFDKFSQLQEKDRKKLIRGVTQIKSKDEMRKYVNKIAENSFQ